MTYEQLVQKMYSTYEGLTGSSPEDASDLGIRIRVLAGEIYAVLSSLDWLEKQKDPDRASGQELEYLAEEAGLQRRPALKASGTLTFGVYTAPWVDLPIPAGTLCRGKEEGPAFVTLEDTLLKSGTKTAAAAAEAVEAGRAGNCGAGTITEMVTVPAGIGYVTNEKAFSGGDEEESDESLRARLRLLASVPPLGGNLSSYKTAVLRHEKVRSVSVVPRAEGVGTVGVYLDGREGSLSSEDVEEIQTELEEMREIGTQVYVEAAEHKPVSLTLSLHLESGWSLEQAKTVCTAAAEDFFRRQEVGRGFRRSALTAALVATGSVWDVTFESPQTDLTVAKNQVTVLGALVLKEAS